MAIALADAGAPWQVVAGVTGALVLSVTILGVAQLSLPQDSSDRVVWWRDRRRHASRRRAARRADGR
ncbi:hypothetical protein [Micromonospora zhanjiangensis]|uniref:Uncharacterized protein n=1 Tax=Micromonospora zhanjiangensis TaxID=1522057 RepID=A0ABV8KSR2_9ACTN